MRHANNTCQRGLRCKWIAVAMGSLVATMARSDDLTQPIRVSPDGHFLTQPNGAPFFWLGEDAWELFQRPNRDEVDVYLSDRARKGYNVVLATLGGVHVEPNRYGEWPFIKHDPARPNAEYFQNVDWIVDRAALYGIRLAIVTAWAPSHRTANPNLTGARMFNTSNVERYGQWLGDRYRRRGIIWILGGDVNPLWPERGWLDTHSSITDFRPLYDAMAKGLKKGGGPATFITYHPNCCSFPGTAEPRTSLYFADRSWLTMNMLQSSHYKNPAPSVVPEIGFNFSWLAPYSYEPIGAEYQSMPTRPIVDGEALFEDLGIDNDPKGLETKGVWTGVDSRQAAYHAVFAGAAGHTYGNHSVWEFYDPARNTPDAPALPDLPPWRKALDRPAAGQMRYLKQLVLSRPYFSRIPDQTLIVGETGEGSEHISATRDKGGRYAMVYLPLGQRVTVDLGRILGLRAVAWWFDPRNGIAKRIQGDYPTTGAITFTPPSNGLGEDWVLVVDDEEQAFGIPGVGTAGP